ncbi:palmitoyltransferase ZDHHC22-like [Liolophura sinensis]|uniref:palmitoyltransferase ZDHHC22-like n=1 Tax=Liolophura sinensis TaxID=3198878 RepID=UPI0031588B36
MFVNWLCVRYVVSSYSPSVYGEDIRQATITSTSSNEELHITEQEVSNNNDLKGTKNNSPSVMYVMSGVSDCGLPQRTVHPYWSWVPCIVCNHSRPPRCHHCALCRTCVLKRDHHCFFVGSCVGYRNMRHFIVFCFWGSVACLYAAIHSSLYYYYIMFEQTTILDMFPVSVHMRWCFGRASGKTTTLTSVLWSLIFFFPLTFHFLYINMDMIVKGQTSFERDNNIRMSDGRSVQNKLKSVFGRYWYLNIIVPLHSLFPALEDPVHWPDVHP